MDIDPTQPWGIALDYFGRATVTESGHAVQIRVYDQTLGQPLEPDPMSGQYPAVSVLARISESGGGDASLFGNGQVTVAPSASGPVTPDNTAVRTAVAAALTDFQARTAAYAALCGAWTPAPPEGGDGDGTGDGGDGSSGDGDGTDPDPDPETDPETDPGTPGTPGNEPTA